MPPTLKGVVRACVYSLIREKTVVRARVWRPRKFEKTIFYEIWKKSKQLFVYVFMIFVFLLCSCEMFDILSFFIMLLFYVFELLLKHLLTPGIFWGKSRFVSFFKVFDLKNYN